MQDKKKTIEINSCASKMSITRKTLKDLNVSYFH